MLQQIESGGIRIFLHVINSLKRHLPQDKGGEGAKELEELNSDRMKVIQLDVCSDEEVNKAVEYIKDNLEDSQRGK